jgi:transcriptional regulator with XRE-family HTH domain
MGRAARRRPRFLATKLREIRNGLSLSQAALIEHLGLPDYINQGEISDFEHGVREPDLLTLLAYARKAGVSIDSLVDDHAKLPDTLLGAKYTSGGGGNSQKGRAMATTTIKLLLLIIIESAGGTTSGENRARARIEKSCLKQHRMVKVNDDEYELTFSHQDEADLDEQIYALFGAIKIEARKRKCSVNVDIREKGGARHW